MPEVALRYDDSSAYERFMGIWSRAVAPAFLGWLAPEPSACWLEVGCGTGIFTQLVVDRSSPRSVIAVDCSPAQIDYARRLPLAAHVDFRVGDALTLSFPDGAFDIVVSALVINFVQEPRRALSEMRRVLRSGGRVGGYVWDFAAERSPSWPMRVAMRKLGMEIPGVPGAQITSPGALHGLFEEAGFTEIESRAIEVTQSFANFEDFWQAQTPSYMPATKMIRGLSDSKRERLMDAVREGLPLSPDGRIQYDARARAIKASILR